MPEWNPNSDSFVTLNPLAAKDFTEGKTVLDMMAAAKPEPIRPNVITFNTLLDKAKDFTEGKTVLDMMAAAKPDPIRPNVITFSTLLDKAKDFTEGKTVLDMMAAAKPEPIRPDVITSFALASKIADQEDARTAVELMQPYNLAGKEFLRALAVSLAQHHSADVVLDWANLFCEIFSVPGYYTDAFNTAMKSYRTRGKKSDVLRIAMAYPHLPEASLAMTLWKDEALAFFETFLNDDLGAVALHAIARVHNYNGDPDLARLWAQRTIQHPQYAAFHPNRQADVVGLAN